jgi:hypothetical protein
VARGRRLGAVCPRARSAAFVWRGVLGAASRAVVLCQSSLSSRRVNGHHPWIRITRVICGQDPGPIQHTLSGCSDGVRSSRGLVLVGCPTGLGLRLHADELEAEIAQPVELSAKL